MQSKVTIQPALEAPVHTSALLPEAHKELQDLIHRLIRIYGEKTQQGVYRIKTARLCTKLNDSQTYIAERQRTGMRAQKFLEEFADTISAKRVNRIDWIYESDATGYEDIVPEPVTPEPKKTMPVAQQPDAEAAEQTDTQTQQTQQTEDVHETPLTVDEPVQEEEKQTDVVPEQPESDSWDGLSARLCDAGFSQSEAEETIQILRSHLGGSNAKMQIYGNMVSAFGGKLGLYLYRILKDQFPEVLQQKTYPFEVTINDELPF